MREAQRKENERKKRVEEVRATCYKLPFSTVYQEVYGVIAGKYEIARESEKRGYIETALVQTSSDSAKSVEMTKITAELVGEDCVRVAMRAEGGGSSSVRAVEDLYLTLHERLQQHQAAPPAEPPATPPEPTEPPADPAATDTP